MPGSARRTSPAATLTVVCGALLLIPVTATGAAEATADVGRSLHTGLAASQWVVNAFFLTFASLMASTGSLADRIGRRRMFAGGIAVFTASMLLATLAPGIGTLVAARLLAGAGAAAATTGGSALIAAAFTGGPSRTRAFGLFGTVLGLGLAFGPVIAGLLVTGLGWRAFFGVAAVALLPSLLAVPLLTESRRDAPGPIDWTGAATFTLGLSAFTFALVEGPSLGWTHGAVLGGFTVCVLLLAAFALVERRHPSPLVDLALLTRPRFVAISAMPFLLAFGFVALTIVLPPYLMATLHASAGTAGLTLMLLTGPALVLPPLTGVLGRWLSQRVLLVLTLLLVAAGTALLALVPGGAGAGSLAAPLLLVGTGFGISLAIMDGAAISAVEPERAGMAAGLFNTFRISGEVVAVTVLGALLTTLTRSGLAGRYGDGAASAATSRLLQGDMTPPPGVAATGYAEAATHAYAGALHDALWALSALSLVGALIVARLLRPTADSSVSTVTTTTATATAAVERRAAVEPAL
ncbi:MFS transporter [Actinomadura harenae]|uniref:MFS transporter n=1 Tax=Actinomadura harenae TaxID=2483351 RepID=A0A3M2LJ98_9ACTN|nr:MFS transporter [Actinomadura harenae]RMI37552.1 MFS transporter [Actinomadura harenae]